jgi:hypothetical protein
MEEIVNKLRSKGFLDDRIPAEIGALWNYGVETVSDPVVKAALLDFLLTETPLYFYVASASLTGTHHPAWQRAISGIVRNTVECCLVLDRQLRIFAECTDAQGAPLPEARDVVLVATILSDTFKYGRKDLSSDLVFDPSHGAVAAEVWRRIAERHGVAHKTREDIRDAIYWHLGRWTPGWNAAKRLSVYADITHRVDMFISDERLDLLYNAKAEIGKAVTLECNSNTRWECQSQMSQHDAPNSDLERAKLCYEQNCEAQRSLNQIMWQIPVIAMTLTGGLWYGVASLNTIDIPVKYGLLLFAVIADLLLILVILRVRSVMAAYLQKIKEFYPPSFANTESIGATSWLSERGVAKTFCLLLFIAAIMSFIGLFVIGGSLHPTTSTSAVPSTNSTSTSQSPVTPRSAITPQSPGGAASTGALQTPR